MLSNATVLKFMKEAANKKLAFVSVQTRCPGVILLTGATIVLTDPKNVEYQIQNI